MEATVDTGTLYTLGVKKECPRHNVSLAGVTFPLYEVTPGDPRRGIPPMRKMKQMVLTEERVERIKKKAAQTFVRPTHAVDRKDKEGNVIETVHMGNIVEYWTDEERALAAKMQAEGKKKPRFNRHEPKAGDRNIMEYLIFEPSAEANLENQAARIEQLEAEIAELRKQAEASEKKSRSKKSGGPSKGKHSADKVLKEPRKSLTFPTKEG